MNKIYKLINQFKHYEWGSLNKLPEFLNLTDYKNLPYAEMWMGTHPGACSQAVLDDKNVNLDSICGPLPILLKILAVDSPLSIQAHPNKEQAKSGFEKENESALSLKAPTRNYKDPNHKPEILCALSPFTLMAGFRETISIQKNLEELLITAPFLKDIIQPLFSSLGEGSLSSFFCALNNLSNIEREYLTAFILENNNEKEDGIISCEQWNLMKNFAKQYPGDIAIISPLYLNLLKLEKGQAVYIPDGILHSYIKGFGIELMTSSDNVLRGGLTHKHVDINELINILHFVPFLPQIITPPLHTQWFYYHSMYDDFTLACMKNKEEAKTFAHDGPAICLVTEGFLKTEEQCFNKGESFVIAQNTPNVILDGDFTLYAAIPGKK